MIFTLFRRLFTLCLNLFLLSLIGFAIFMRDPANQVFSEPHFYSGYIRYAGYLLQGDLGITYNGGESLLSVILMVLPPTLELCFMALLLGLFFGIPLGLVGAFKREHFIGKIIAGLSSVGSALPVFWIAPIALYFSAVYRWEIAAVGQINLLYEIRPITGFAIIDVWFVDAPYRLKIIQNLLQHLALPTLVLMIIPMMEVVQIVQQRAGWVLRQNYVELAQNNGLSVLRILRQYILRNTLPMIIPHLPRMITLILTLCMLVEGSFGWPGMGRWIIEAVAQHDYNAISAGVLVIGLFVMIINILANLTMFLLDPLAKKGWYAR